MKAEVKREGGASAATNSASSSAAAARKPARVFPYANGAPAAGSTPAVKAEPCVAVSPVKREPPPPAQPFRSPLKNASAAAASTVVAELERAKVNAINAAAAATAAAAGVPDSTSGVCCVCQHSGASFVVLPCMHLCLCSECQGSFRRPSSQESPPGVPKQCPVCRTRIEGVKKIFISG